MTRPTFLLLALITLGGTNAHAGSTAETAVVTGVGAAGAAIGKEVTQDGKKPSSNAKPGPAAQVRVNDDERGHKHKKPKDHPPGHAYGWDKNHGD